jgi:hypothetical protein
MVEKKIGMLSQYVDGRVVIDGEPRTRSKVTEKNQTEVGYHFKLTKATEGKKRSELRSEDWDKIG